MQIAFYSPDRHIVYDGNLPDRTGVGGGITQRIRTAAALARRGHNVSVICNCPREAVISGVRYVPLDAVRQIACDVLAMHSSGGGLDLTPLLEVSVQARIRVLVLSGPDLPKASEELRPDAFYVCTNFVRRQILRVPFVAPGKVLVAHCGVNSWNRAGLLSPARKARRLIYSSHPSKGLQAACEIARELRRRDSGFELHSFGGNRLWGGTDSPPAPEAGIVYGGLVNQRRMAEEYKRAAFSLQLQTRLEPFGITIVEAMAAGCLVVASPVGSYPELIQHGENGFLVEGDPADPATVQRAVELIWDVSRQPAYMAKLRRQAYATPFDWDVIAQVWEAHLASLMDSGNQPAADWARCLECGAPSLVLADGYHCCACGYFARQCGTLRP